MDDNDKHQTLGSFIEAAMVDAINQAAADGITDPGEINTRMMAASRWAKEEFKRLEDETQAAKAEHPAAQP